VDTEKKKPTSFKLSPEALSLMRQLSEHLGLSQAGVVEMAIRKFSEAESSETRLASAELSLPKQNGHTEHIGDYTARGPRIRAIRLRKKHWRQEDLAKAAGLQTGTISRIETGFHRPQLATIVKIGAALGVEIDEIVDWHDDPDE
jgi:DNA-binding XRE family transcriptional regulator/predicted DNA-binding protein